MLVLFRFVNTRSILDSSTIAEYYKPELKIVCEKKSDYLNFGQLTRTKINKPMTATV